MWAGTRIYWVFMYEEVDLMCFVNDDEHTFWWRFTNLAVGGQGSIKTK